MTVSSLSALKARLDATRLSLSSGKSLNFDRLGGDEDVVLGQPVRWGLEIVHVRTPQKLCMGKIGAAKVCLETLAPGCTRCGIASHASKVTLGDDDNMGSMLLVKANERAAFCQPCLPADTLSPDLVESLLGRAGVDWPSQFNLISCEEVQDLGKEEEMADRAQTVKKLKDGYMTPVKRVQTWTDMEATERILKESAAELKQSVDVTTALQDFVDAQDEVKKELSLAKFHATVAERLDMTVFHGLTTQEWVGEGNRNSQKIFVSMEDTVAGLRALISMVEGQVGTRSKVKIDPLPPTLWGSLGELHEKLVEVEDTLGSVGDTVMAFEQRTAANVESKEPPAKVDEELNTSTSDSSTGSENLFFQAIHRRPGQPDPVQVEPGVIQSLDKRVTVLEKRDKFDSSQIVVVRDHVLRNRDDVGALLEQYMGSPCDRIPAGAFVSPHNLLNQIVSRLSGSSPELKDYKTLADLKLGKLERDAAASCMRPLPILCTGPKLGGHSYGIHSTACRFKMLPSFKEWGLASDEDSLCHKFHRELRASAASTRAYIDSELGLHPELVMIANNVLTKSSHFVESLFLFMSDTYESMFLSFKNQADTWDLVCSSVEQIFSTQFKGPLSAMVAQDFSDVKRTLLDTIWTTLRIGVVVEEFLRIGLKDHHCLVGAANRFMIKQYAKSNRACEPTVTVSSTHDSTPLLNSLSAKVKAQDEEIKALKKLITGLTTKVKSVESRADQALHAAKGDGGSKKKKDTKPSDSGTSGD